VRYGPRTTFYNRFVRGLKAGVSYRLLGALLAAYDGNIVMIDSSFVRIRRHGAAGRRGIRRPLVMVTWDAPVAA